MKHSNTYIFSIGHSSKSINIFLDKLKENKVGVLVDVRSRPVSRFCPHFNQNALRGTLAKANILYLYRGQNLGGLGENVDYEKTIDELVDMVKKGSRVAVCCSEGSYLKCHRHLTLTPSFEDRGLSVIHIEYEKEPKQITRK